MISISGHGGTGKTTAGDVLTQEGFWVFDVGTFWRSFRDTIAPGMNVGELNFAMKEYVEDDHWEDKFLAAVIRNNYDRGMNNMKDLAIVGYRSLTGVNDVFKRIEGKVFPDRPRSYLHFVSPIELAKERIVRRDGVDLTTGDLEIRYATEVARGLDDFLVVANFIINNENGLDSLREDILKIIYNDLAYPKDIIEVPRLTEGQNRRVLDFLGSKTGLNENDLSRFIGKERK